MSLKLNYSTIFWLLLAMSIWAGKATAQQVPATNVQNIQLKPEAEATLPGQHIPSEGAYLLQLEAGQGRERVLQAGLKPLRWLSPELVVVASHTGKVSDVNARSLPLSVRWKLAAGLEALKPDQQEYSFMLSLANGAEFPFTGAKNIALLDAWPAQHAYAVRCTGKTLFEQILPHPDVHAVTSWHAQPREESLLLDANLSVNRINQVHAAYPELQGQEQTVSIKEQAFHADDLDLLGRTLESPLANEGNSRHATDMATHIAGAANLAERSRGVVPQAFVSSSDFNQLFPDPADYFQTYGIATQNHSYGTVVENFYGELAQAYDQQSQELPYLVHVFSAGNSGLLTPTDGPYADLPNWATLTGNYKQAKNILTVAALDTLLQPQERVSRGPAYDGRVKPELTAYSAQGSSSSAALVSGAAVLLQQAYQQEFGDLPAAALLRGILLNSTQELDAPGPDFISGYGNLDVYRSLQNLKEGNFARGNLAAGETETFTLNVPANARNLKVMLAWHDPAANPNDASALVNDLDLKLLAPDGSPWLPWVLNAYPHPDSLRLPATRKEDHQNNQEMISLMEPQAGMYTLEVSASDLPVAGQEFFVVWQWDETNDFGWTYPAAPSDNMPHLGEGGSIFRWQTTREGTGSLWWRRQEADAWEQIEENIDLSQPFYQWTPEAGTYLAQVQMRTNEGAYTSGWFTVSPEFRPSIGFNCTDSLMLQWPQVPNASGYRVYSLQGNYLEPKAELTDTSVVFSKAELTSPYLAVAPLLADTLPALRSLTFDVNLQGVDCYIMAFTTAPREPEGVELQLMLGTTYQIEQVTFERSNGTAFQDIATINDPASPMLFALDLQPANGANIYRTRLDFVNGETLYSSQDTVYVLRQSEPLLFPNPLPRGQELRLLTTIDTFEPYQLNLYNSRGALVKELELFPGLERFPVPTLPAGIYFYRLSLSGEVYSGRLILL